MENIPPQFKSGFIAIVGAPNAGKSTLLNRMLGEKISITSKKPQTTRNRILGVMHRPGAQLVFVDTPGIHKTEQALNVRIVGAAVAAMGEGDAVLFLVDAAHSDAPSEALLLEKLKAIKQPVVLALNKIDLVAKETLLVLLDKWRSAHEFAAMVPISATRGHQVDDLLKAMEALLPEGPPLFPEDTLTDVPEKFIAAEIIREKVFRLTGEEIPYSVAVTVETFKEKKSGALIVLDATIHVEKGSQKGIVIGKQGQKLKQIGEVARKELEHILHTKVYLKLFVRVQKNWSKDTKALRNFGY
jgi:GTPase